MVEGLDPVHVRRDRRQQYPAAKVMLPDPCRVLDRVVDVVKEYLPDPGAALGEPAAEILEPAVVGLDAGAAALVLVLLWRARGQGGTPEGLRRAVWGNART